MFISNSERLLFAHIKSLIFQCVLACQRWWWWWSPSQIDLPQAVLILKCPFSNTYSWFRRLKFQFLDDWTWCQNWFKTHDKNLTKCQVKLFQSSVKKTPDFCWQASVTVAIVIWGRVRDMESSALSQLHKKCEMKSRFKLSIFVLFIFYKR